MPGRFTLNPPAVPLSRPPARIVVYRVNELTAGPPTYEMMPNLRCLSYHILDGAEPGSARFRYSFGDILGNPKDPQRIEDVFPIDAAPNPGLVATDDLLAVTQIYDDGTEYIRFSGYVQLPQVDLGPTTESATFECLATPIREFDTPLKGAVYRAGDVPSNIIDVQTDLPIRFNPDGKPNACLDANMSGTAPDLYPVFMDVKIIRVPEVRTYFTLSKAASHIQQQGNGSQIHVNNCPVNILNNVLQAYEPIADGTPVDLNDPTTYTTKDIIVPDVDVTGDAWPTALEKLIKPHGFGMRWNLDWDKNRYIIWTLEVFDESSLTPRKSLYIQKAGSTYDPSQTNVASLSLVRDRHALFNDIVVDTAPVAYEASFILACGFYRAAGDISTLRNYVEGSPTFQTDPYRLFIFGEAGDPWAANVGDAVGLGVLPSLNKVLGKPVADASGKLISQYAVRRRKPIGELFTQDASKKPLHWELWISKDYPASGPEVYDPTKTATWEKISNGGIELLPDQIGIRLTMTDPTSWHTGAKGTDAVVSNAGKLNIVKCLAAPDAANPNFVFRLTCVIEGDKGLIAKAPKRVASPTLFTIRRRPDARDRFKRQIISQYGQYAVGGADKDALNDTTRATDYADSLRRAHEKAVFAGTVTVSRITNAYRRGDKIDMIVGRNMSLQTNSGIEQGESKAWPVANSFSFTFDPHQETQIHLTDRRSDPARRRTT